MNEKQQSQSYPGSKGGGGVAERIIGLMPRHRAYVEPCLGMGAVLRLAYMSRVRSRWIPGVW